MLERSGSAPVLPTAAGHPGQLFDPLTGDWLPPPDAKQWDPEAPKKSGGATAWNVVLGIDLTLLALFIAFSIVALLSPPDNAPAAGPLDQTTLAIVSIVSFVMMGVIPFFWVVGTRQGGMHGAIHYLRLEHAMRAIPWGLLVGVVIWGAFVLVMMALYYLGLRFENPQGEAIASSMTIPLALLVAFCAAVGEEILFRGVLQRWVGVWGQAALFGLAHIDYGTPLQVILPLLLGLLFGYLVKRGARLWIPIAAHFTFDFIQLGLAVVLKDQF